MPVMGVVVGRTRSGVDELSRVEDQHPVQTLARKQHVDGQAGAQQHRWVEVVSPHGRLADTRAADQCRALRRMSSARRGQCTIDLDGSWNQSRRSSMPGASAFNEASSA